MNSKEKHICTYWNWLYITYEGCWFFLCSLSGFFEKKILL